MKILKFNLKFFLSSLIFISMGVCKANFAETIKIKDNNLDINYLDNNSNNDYILGEGDVISVSLSRDIEKLTKVYTVSGEGTIILPRIKTVYISGLTINELTGLLNEKYKSVLRYPDVEITIIAYRPVRFLISGEVENPGMYTLKSGSYNPTSNNKNIFELKESSLNEQVTLKNNKKESRILPLPRLFDAIKMAGGITNYSDLSNIQILRINSISEGGGKIVAKINFLDFLDNGQNYKNIRILDGDKITINRSNVELREQLSKSIRTNLNSRFIEVFLSGSITSPGLLSISKSSTLNDAISVAGGLKTLSGRIYFTRFNQNGSIDERKIIYRANRKRGGYNNPYLKSGDIIRVGRSTFSIASEVITEITSPFVGIYTVKELIED